MFHPKQEKNIITLSLLLVMLLVFLTPAVAQEVTAAITGTVVDPSGAAIPNASVIAKDTERGITLPTQTNETGVYTLPRVPIGTYTLRIEAKGFQTAVHPAFTLTLNQTARIDVAMKVGQVGETVEVTGAAPVLQTSSTEVSTLIDSKTTDSMPLMSRNYMQLTLITPGAVHPNPQNMTDSQTMTSAARPYINGNREQANNMLLDGMDNNQIGDNEVGYTPNVDAIQEFNLISQNASAEFGDFQGGIINTSTKSGTNRFHGNVFEYLRNDALNANRWANGLTKGGAVDPKTTNSDGTLLKPKMRWNMFGGTIGGPIIKDKLFFFADYQGQRYDFPASPVQVRAIPVAFRTGDFSSLCTAGFNSSDVCTDATQTIYNPTTHLPFTHNQIPTAMISPVVSKLFGSGFYPTQLDSNNMFTQFTGHQLNNDQGDIKIDWVATSKDTIFGRWSQMRLRNPWTDSWALATPTNPTAIEPSKNSVLNWDHSFGPNLLNEVRVGFNWVGYGQTFDDHGLGNFAQTLGIANGNVNGPGLPLMNLPGMTFGNAWIAQNFGSTVIQAQDSVIVNRGRHNMHAGFEFKRWRYNSAYGGNSGINGTYNFNGEYTASAAGGGNQIADFILGMPNLVQRGGATGWGQRSSVFATYFQDNWRLTDTVTLNLGLRYENHTPWVEANDHQVNFGLTSGAIEFAGQNGNSRALYNSYNLGWDFQPRLGFAWAPKKFGGKSVLRAAYSVSSYSEGMGANNRLTQNAPFVPGEIANQYTCITGEGGYSCDPNPGLAAGIPLPAPPSTTVTPATYAGLQIRMWDPNWQPAISHQYNVSIQQQLNNSTTFQIGYVGQKTNHLTNFEWAKQGILVSPGVVKPSPYVAGNPALQSAIGAIRGTFANGNARYDALQAVLQKKMSSGLQGQLSYTYSKCLTDAPGFYGSSWSASQTSVGMPSAQNIYDLQGDWGNCYFDATHALTGYFTYALPFGKNKQIGGNMNPFLNAIVGNWEVGGMLTLRTGFHLEVNSWGDPSGTGAFATRPNLTGPINYIKKEVPGGIQWFDPTPLVMPTSGFGNEGVGAIVGPPLKTFDMSLHKSFPLGESKRFEFRAEAMNLTNTPILLFGAGSTFFDGLTGTTGRTTGLINQASNERQIQFALKFYF
jgi:hypothetical protein